MTNPTPLSTAVRRSVTSLFAASAVSVLAIGLSYLLYSRLLTPVEFGLYSTALVVSGFGQLVLDGGLKNTIIKSLKPPDAAEQGTLLLLMSGASIALTAALAVSYPVMVHAVHVSQRDYSFLAAFGAIWLLSYPWLAIPTALLERSFEYRRLAVIESIGQVLERAGPAFLLLLTPLGIWSFVVGLLFGRLFRVVAISATRQVLALSRTLAPPRQVWHFVAEGGWLQLSVLVSLVRDNLHVLLIGPLYGPAWVGYYGWAFQTAQASSQAFVQISARVSVPVFAQTADADRRWAHCLEQARLLSMLTAPVLVATLLLMPSINAHLFHGKWLPALMILPLIFLRMLPGLATTPLGSLVMVDRGGRVLAGALAKWTAVEVTAAIVLSLWLGPIGLAWSSGFGAWFGLAILVHALHRKGSPVGEMVRVIVLRPSMLVGIGLAIGAALLIRTQGSLPTTPIWVIIAIGGAVVLLSYLTERYLRTQFRMLLTPLLT